MHIDKFTDPGFIEVLGDAIFCHLMASNEENPFKESVFSKSSVVTTAIAIENAANCLLKTLEGSGRFFDQCEKLPPLDKYEMVYRHYRLGMSAERRHELKDSKLRQFNESALKADIAELISIRNDFVHRKASKLVYTRIDHTEREDGCHLRSFDIDDLSEYERLSIPKRHSKWRSEHSKRVLERAIDFWNWFVLDLCNLKVEDATDNIFLATAPIIKSDGTETELVCTMTEEHYLELISSFGRVRFLECVSK